MTRTSMIPQQTDILLSIPSKYVGKKIEVLLYSVEEIIEETPPQLTMADFWGKLSDESAQKLHDNVNVIRKEWERDI
jgi:hypothetical protein